MSGQIVTFNRDSSKDIIVQSTPQYTFAITPIPSDAVVKINDTVQSSVTVDENTNITYEVSKKGYTTQTGTYTVTEDKTLNIELNALSTSQKIQQVYTYMQDIKAAINEKGGSVGNDITAYAIAIGNIGNSSSGGGN